MNAGATWFYEATRSMNDAQRMLFRASHAAANETRGLTAMVGLAFGNLIEQARS